MQEKGCSMFCPSCGKEIPDNAKFCPSCGKSFADRGDSAQKPAAAAQQPADRLGQQGAPAAWQAPASARQTSAPARQAPAAAQGTNALKTPLIAIIAGAVVLVVVIVAITMTMCAPGGGTSPSAKSQGKTPSKSESVTATGPSKDKFEVTNLKLTTDSTSRYVITGTVTSRASEACMVPISFSGTTRSQGHYGDEKEGQSAIDSADSITPLCLSGNAYEGATRTLVRVDLDDLAYQNCVVYDLQPGEQRDFTLYPQFVDKDEVWSDISAEIGDVSTTSSFEKHCEGRYDDGKCVEITITNVERSTSSGKTIVKGTYANRSNTYIASGRLLFVPCSKQGEPIAENSSDYRPEGAAIVDYDISEVKPGAEGSFEVALPEGSDHAEFLHSWLKADSKMGGWQ